MAFLKAVGGPNVGQVWDIRKPRCVLGRHPDCDVAIDQLDASRHHAQIVRENLDPADGRLFCVSGPPVMVDAMERVLDEISFDAAEKGGHRLVVDPKYVRERLDDVLADEDLSKYIL